MAATRVFANEGLSVAVSLGARRCCPDKTEEFTMNRFPPGMLTRRRFLQDATTLALLAGLERLVPAYAWPSSTSDPSASALTDPNVIDLSIRKETLDIGGRAAAAMTISCWVTATIRNMPISMW